MGSFKDLIAYRKSFDLAMQIFEFSKTFPKEEKYSLTDQIRRSSRAVCANIAEGYRKRQYPAHFISKVSDSDMENTETQTWLDFASSCGYLDKNNYKELYSLSEEVGRLLNHMISYPENYGVYNQKLKSKS